MSVFQFQPVGATAIRQAVTANTATTIVDATDGPVAVGWFQVVENAGGTQTLTVDIYDGTTAHYLGDDAGTTWRAKAVTADNTYTFSQGYIIPIGSKLRVTSNHASGQFTVHGVRFEGN